MPINTPKHLDEVKIVNMGSFYTPHKFVLMAGQWLKDEQIDASYTIMDSSCGYGAFFNLHKDFPKNKYIGNDIDDEAIKVAAENFPFVTFFNENALKNVGRSQYKIKENDRLIIVGNPPYNDVTSQSKQNIKCDKMEMDPDIQSRDLGVSSLKAYAKLSPDYVLILHPLSYLIKKTNFSKASDFFSSYRIINHIVFPSSEFENTSSASVFPIIMALYKRDSHEGLDYKEIWKMRFSTTDGNHFSLSERDYVGDYIKKYPHNDRYEEEILFYTLRDINALKRSRTFINERIINAVDVDPQKLSYYCYIDCFKKFASIPYYLGNFDVPFIKNEFIDIEDAVVSISKFNHPDVFGENDQPEDSDIIRVKDYINKVISYK